MNAMQLTFLVFAVVLFVALLLDLGLLSRKNTAITMRFAAWQTFFWVCLSFVFAGFLWIELGRQATEQYLSAYLLEWSLSIDNIFVFIILFSFFKISDRNHSRVLLSGILMAIVLRILFITLGSELVRRFEWIMYIFGALLIYTGIKLFRSGHHEEEVFDPEQSLPFRLMTKYLRTTNQEPEGRFFMRISGKWYLTKLAMVVIMLGLVDIVFAVDSIPAAFSIIPDPKDKLLLYSSNIFAVLGLRSLFFLLQGASRQFVYLQQGIAFVLLFIGAKMLVNEFNPLWHIPAWASLMVIVVSIGGSVLYSLFSEMEKKKKINK